MGVPLVPARKPGKLPAATYSTEFALEYGNSTLELHTDGIHANERVLLVDDLLASSFFGEHQARYWLDAVRYGDTHGLHLDNRRGIFPYRDWVVQALNRNLRLDEFITWQLAVDLLPTNPSKSLQSTYSNR